MQDKHYIPQNIDNPLRIILFTIDEFILMLITLVISLLIFSLVVGMVMMLVEITILRYIRGDQGHHYIKNLLCWYLPGLESFFSRIGSVDKHYIG